MISSVFGWGSPELSLDVAGFPASPSRTTPARIFIDAAPTCVWLAPIDVEFFSSGRDASPAPRATATVPAAQTPGRAASAPSISSSSTRCPRTSIWLSARPINATPRPGTHRTRSPVRYAGTSAWVSEPSAVTSARGGLAVASARKNAWAVASGLFRYPCAIWSPISHNSPSSPGGTTSPDASQMRIDMPGTGQPTVTAPGVIRAHSASTVASDGPYMFHPMTCDAAATWSHSCCGMGSPPSSTALICDFCASSRGTPEASSAPKSEGVASIIVMLSRRRQR